MDIKQTFKKAREIRDRSKLADQKIKDLFGVISPAQYPPFIEFDEFSGFIDGIRAIKPDFAEDLGWYFYEVNFERYPVWTITESNGKKHDISDDDTMIAYLQYTYGMGIK